MISDKTEHKSGDTCRYRNQTNHASRARFWVLIKSSNRSFSPNRAKMSVYEPFTFSPNAQSQLLLPSPSSTLFERSMGALVSNFKGSVGLYELGGIPIQNASEPVDLQDQQQNGKS